MDIRDVHAHVGGAFGGCTCICMCIVHVSVAPEMSITDAVPTP